MTRLARKIAVISDIHIGRSARSKDLCPVARGGEMRDEGFSQTFEDFIKMSGLRADHLIVSGDLSSRAAVDEVMFASKLLEKWATALGVGHDEIYFVPGNHDVDWTVLELAAADIANAELRWSQRYDPFIKTQTTLRSRMSSAVGHFFETPFAGIWESPRLLVGALNSSAHDTPKNRPHYGYASDATLDWLDQELAKGAKLEEQLRIFVVHHHPHQYSDPFPQIPEFRDFSILQNAQRLQMLLRKHKFDLLIHGHKHVPRFETVLVGSDFPIHVLGAGSFCVDLGSSYSGSYTNQFHIIEVKGRLSPADVICGVLSNWSFTGPNGWLPSDGIYTGIEHSIGFGYFISYQEAKNAIQKLVQARGKSATRIKWSELVADDSRLRYLQPRTQMEALTAIAAEEGFEPAGSPPADVVLYK